MAVILTAVIDRREITEYSPWCSCKVQAQVTIMIPRPFPCKRHSKHANKRLYLVLLILLAGDVQLNPGPTSVGIDDSDSHPTGKARMEEDAREAKYLVCDKAPDSLMLRSRTVADTIANAVWWTATGSSIIAVRNREAPVPKRNGPALAIHRAATTTSQSASVDRPSRRTTAAAAHRRVLSAATQILKRHLVNHSCR